MKCMNKVDIKVCRAACCGPVPIQKEIIEKHKDKLNKKAIKLIMSHTEEIWVTRDATCGFLDKNFLCKIYEDRPFVCRLMGTKTPDQYTTLDCSYLSQSGNPEIIISKNKEV